MVLYNPDPGMSLDPDPHFVPSVHVDKASGEAIKAYIADAAGDANGELTGFERVDAPGPNMAGFSSRGWISSTPDLVKPDVTAPGVGIIAATTPTPVEYGMPGETFAALSGTSMSSPHVAGLGALLKQAHPYMTPQMIKSALMTTGSQDVRKEDGETPADPFDMGGGHVNPLGALDPGLVFNSGFVDDVRYLCGAVPGTVSAAGCNFFNGLWSESSPGGTLDPSNYNVASIGIGSLAGEQTVVRSVYNVGEPGTYTPVIDAPPGVEVRVEPETLNFVGFGQRASFAVTFTVTEEAQMDTWAFGSLTWSDGTHDVRSPLAVRPVRMASPAEVSGSGAEGSLSYEVGFGYSGDFEAVAAGLFPADRQDGTVADDPSNDINTALGSGVGIAIHPVYVPAGSLAARFSLFDDYTGGNDDLDLYVFDPSFGYVGGSGSATSAEQVDVSNGDFSPIAGGWYYVVVHGWQTDGPQTTYTLHSWAIQPSASGNMTVSGPGSASLGATGTINVDWALDPGQKYMGAVGYLENGELFAATAVRIDTD
jgi:hypothetical protein